MMRPLRGMITLILIAIRYAKPTDDEKDIVISGNYLHQIPEPYLRPLIRCLMQNGGKLDSGPFKHEETEAARPYLMGEKEYLSEFTTDVPPPKINKKKWY